MPEVTRGQVSLHYESGGSGATIVLVPGLGMSCGVWADARARLEPSYRVIAVDPRGSGQSAKPPGPYTGADAADDLAAILDAEGVEQAHVVGMSMGGLIAQEVALCHPARVRSLVLVSTYAAADEWFRRAMSFRREVIERIGFAEQFRLAVLFVFSPKAFRTIPDFIAGLERRIAENPPEQEAYVAQLDYCLAHDATSRLGGVRAPTLVLTGSEDFLTSRFQGQQLAELIPGAEYREVPGASHGFVWEEPELFASLVSGFVDRVTAAAPG